MERLKARWAGSRRDESGMGLVEMLVALTVASVVLSGVGIGLIQALVTTRDSTAREVAAQLASEAIDQARSTSDIPNLAGTTYTKTVDNNIYTVVRTVTTYLNGGATSPCDGSGNASVKYKKISIRVTWGNMRPGTASVRSQTLLTPSASLYDPTKGNLGAKVLDGLGKPVEGVLVTATDSTGSSETQYTDESGCAFFDSVTPDSYTVTASLSGYVSTAGQAVPTMSTTVAAGNTSAVAFTYDAAGALNLQLGDPNYPAPASVPVELYNTALLPDGTVSYFGTGTSRTLTSLFPFASGYSVWAGSCVDADPAGMAGGTTPYHVGGVRPAAVTTSASGLPTKAVAMAKLRVVVLNGLGAPVPGAVVQVAHAGSALCDTTENYTLAPTDGTGTVKASLPWGTWNFTVAGRTLSAPVTPNFDPTSNEIYVEVRTL